MAKPRKPNDLFGTINSINLKTPIEYDKKEASAYMLLLWLSHDKDLRFYVDDTSYYTPNSTTATGGGLPAGTDVSHIKIFTEPTISADMGGLVKTDFSGKIVGAMRLI